MNREDNRENLTNLAALERMAERNIKLRTFLLRLTDPEDLGHAVTAEVRKLALELATNTDNART